MRKSNEKKKGLLSLRALVTCLFICTLVLTRVTFSKYITVTSGADSARVAKFNITSDVTTFDDKFAIELDPTSGEIENSFTLKVNNHSETAVRLTATIETEGNLPLAVTAARVNAQDESGVPTAMTVLKAEDFSFSFTDDLTMAQEGNYQIYIKWDNPEVSVEQNGNDNELYIYANGVCAVRLIVKAEQID